MPTMASNSSAASSSYAPYHEQNPFYQEQSPFYREQTNLIPTTATIEEVTSPTNTQV